MAITYPISLPTVPGFRSVQFAFNTTAGFSASPFQGGDQVQKWSREFLEAVVSLPALYTRAQAETWIAALMSLGGRSGTFLLGDPLGKTPRGIGTGTPLVNGASQTGESLITDGWTISQTGILKAGDWMQIGTGTGQRIYKVMQDANSNGSGQATFDIRPRLRESPADNAPITVSNTKGVFRLTENRTEWDIDEILHVGLSFRCMEAI